MRTQPQDITLKNAINNINETHEKYTSTQDIVTICLNYYLARDARKTLT